MMMSNPPPGQTRDVHYSILIDIVKTHHMQQTIFNKPACNKADGQTARLSIPVQLLISIISIGTLVACGGSSDNPLSAQETADLTTSAEENLQGQNSNENSNENSGPTTDNGSGEVEEPDVTDNQNSSLISQVRLPSGGHLSNPEFQWPAVEGASSYRLVIEDNRGDHISQQLTSQQANCPGTTDACRFTPSVQIHDSILKWRTESFNASGDWIETSEDVSFNTLPMTGTHVL